MMSVPEPVDLCIKGNVVNVTTGVIEKRTLAIDDGVIIGFGDRTAKETLTAEYVTPGLIDAHMHVEASMVTLPQYGAAVLPHGVTSVVHDPHEIANVLGPAGIRKFCADADRTPLKAQLTVPSSVPASSLQDTGGAVDAEAVDDLLGHDQAIALGEVMNAEGVLDGDREIHRKIVLAREAGCAVDGHLPGITGERLQRLAQVIDNDHESVAFDEARQKVDAGLRVFIREGSTCRNLDALVPLVDTVDTRRLSLCTDERNPSDLANSGGVNMALQRAMAAGVEPVTAVQLATLNTAEAYNLPFGRIEPGAPADLVLLSELESWSVDHVIVDGVVDPTVEEKPPTETSLPTDTVAFDSVAPADLAVHHPGSGPVPVRVIDAVGDIRTERATATLAVGTVGGEQVVMGNPDSDVLPIAVIERHGGDGTIGSGFVSNLGLDRGAIGTTVAHDAHNCLVTGVSHDSMARVANHLRKVGGGITVFDPETESFTTVQLPIGGLLSEMPIKETAAAFDAVVETADRIGLSVPGGLLELTYLALEVVPTYRLTNNGLVDAETMEPVNVVVE